MGKPLREHVSKRLCRVLVVDDEAAMREVLQARLERWGYEVQTATCVEHARGSCASFDPHVVISDLVLPDATGLDLLKALQASDPDRVVLLITAYGTIDAAVSALKGGASDFLTKPLDYVALRRKLDEIELGLRNESRTELLAPRPGPPNVGPGGMIGSSAAQARLLESIRRAATSEAPVLIVGESGSGKELVARTIHQLGPRGERPFVPVNTAAIPETLAEGEFFGFERGAFTGADRARSGLFEEADGGTLFLDEITEMPLTLQPKFLRVLEDGHIRRVGGRTETRTNVRLVAATNRDPLRAVAEGRFRRDLMYRLDVLRIDVPPLRHRKDDIAPLVDHFLGQCARRYQTPPPSITQSALSRLAAHDWPGNVRELRNVIERAFVAAQGRPIEVSDLGVGADMTAPDPAGSSLEDPAVGDSGHGIVIPFGVTAAEAERILILETLKRTRNNKAETARRLGLDVKTIRNKLKSFEAEGHSG